MMNLLPATFRLRLVCAIALVTALGGCAPGAWNATSDYDAFLDTIGKECPQRLGNVLISTLVDRSDAYFLDTTAKLYYGKIDAGSYRQSITAFSVRSADNDKAVDCIVAHLPQVAPSAPGLLPSTGAGRADAPPPDSR